MVGSPAAGRLSHLHKSYCQQKAWSLFHLLHLLFPGVHMLLRVDAASVLPKGSFLFPAMVFWYRLLNRVRIQRQHAVLSRVRAMVQHDRSVAGSPRVLFAGSVILLG
jgi:hypothetical protein